MFEFLLLDMDDTILDFHQSEYVALGKTLESMGLPATEEVRSRYSQINKGYWEMLERGEVTREELAVGRFAQLFREYGIDADPVRCARSYEANLGQYHYFLPGALEALESLKKKYKLYVVSNGTRSVQKGRMEGSGLIPYFLKVFISEDVGFNKPAKGFFDRVFASIEGFDPKKAIIVGDSLTSDILGGINAGIATCWVAPKDKEARADIRPDYRIESLSQLENLLESL